MEATGNRTEEASDQVALFYSLPVAEYNLRIVLTPSKYVRDTTPVKDCIFILMSVQ